MKRVTTNASTWHSCVCMARINLCCLIIGHSTFALITSNICAGFYLKNGAQGLMNHEQFAQAASRVPLVHGDGEGQNTASASRKFLTAVVSAPFLCNAGPLLQSVQVNFYYDKDSSLYPLGLKGSEAISICMDQLRTFNQRYSLCLSSWFNG